MIHCHKPGERLEKVNLDYGFTIPDGYECRCNKCGWGILIHEGMVYTSNRYVGTYNNYHSWCHDQGYRCEP